MARKSRTRTRPGVEVSPRKNMVQPASTPVPASSGFTTLLENATQEMLVVTYWFDPPSNAGRTPVTVRFTGRRADVKGRMQSKDMFSQDETIEQVVPGSGPLSITAKIRGINPGKWVVTAHMPGSANAARGTKGHEDGIPATDPHHPIIKIWRKWAPSVEPDETVSTCLLPLGHVPGILPGIWGAMVGLGMVIAFILQALLISRDHLAVGPWWVVTAGAIAVGILGAKVWYIIQYRHQQKMNGWCIQGFIAGASLMAALLLIALRIPAGIFLDVTAPGLLFAMSVGRIGCFFAGCCGGPLTASRWGVWSSDQQVGGRRVPTQLMESALALSLGVGTLVKFQIHGSAGGAFFVGGLAAYTLVRQGILHLRAEQRKTRLGVPITTTFSALVLIAAIVLLVR